MRSRNSILRQTPFGDPAFQIQATVLNLYGKVLRSLLAASAWLVDCTVSGMKKEKEW
jgi:hypothetical protein